MSAYNHSETSSTLLRCISEGDQTSWVRFIEQYKPLLIRRCRELGLSAEDSDCMTQEVFLQLFRRVDEFNRQRAGSFRRWLRLVVQSRVIDNFRKKKVPIDHEANLDFASCLIPEEVAPESKHRQKIDRMIEMIRTQFSDRDWAIFYLTMGEERPVREVAQELGVSENSVYLCKSRMLKKLRTIYGDGEKDAD